MTTRDRTVFTILLCASLYVIVITGLGARQYFNQLRVQPEEVEFLAGAYDSETPPTPARWLNRHAYATVRNPCPAASPMRLKLTLAANESLLADNPRGIRASIQTADFEEIIEFSSPQAITITIPIPRPAAILSISVEGRQAGRGDDDLRRLHLFLQDLQWSC